ncbi:hypothetical protein [Leisingera sp. NJS204]|uniref:hypothetical protein n=1 Tax=Leisingera sp. NJS204 TaxID=2508307 RepID=UPI0010137C23|nr:hypothetical protein [Leisingera sp. NJS204]QAX31299.1 hypothetical protein ETW24_19010 [Leisingera sp. NJS204]
MTLEQVTAGPGHASLEKLVDLILDTTDPAEQIQFLGWVLSGKSHVQHKQALVLAQMGRCHPETARLWLSGATKCKCAGRLYMKARIRFASELEFARAYGEFINRDLIAEAQS